MNEELNATKKKKPYNLDKEKKVKKAAYRTLISAEVADRLYDEILRILAKEKRYKDPSIRAKDVAKELKTNTRYLSAVVNSRFGKNFNEVLNEYRIRDAKYLLIDKRYANKSVEEIAHMIGFANRQSFYAAFYKHLGMTPKEYRQKMK